MYRQPMSGYNVLICRQQRMKFYAGKTMLGK